VNQNDQLEQSLRQAFAPHEPDPRLKQKALDLRRRSSRKPIWLACGAASLAAAACVAVIFALPTTSLAEEVIKKAAGYQGHLTTYAILPNGHWKRTGDEWCSGNKRRVIDTSGLPSEFLDNPDLGCMIVWNTNMGMAKIVKKGRAEGPSNPWPDVLNPQNLKDLLANRGINGQPTLERTTFNGQPADRVTFSSGQGSSNTLYADPKTHRLLGWAFQFRRMGPGSRPQDSYPRLYVVDQKPIPAHIFDPVFNVNGVPTDVLAGRAQWQDRLAKPLEVFQVDLLPRPVAPWQKLAPPSCVVAVRSVIVNPAGDVFVLFTGLDMEQGSNIIPSVIRDSTGGRYRQAIGFRPSDFDPKAEFMFDGKHLDGRWFVRLAGGTPKGPISVGFKEEGEPLTHLAFTYTAEPERIHTDVPSYMPYMSLPIGTHEDWLQTRYNTLAEDREDAKDFAGEERYLRLEIESIDQLGPDVAYRSVFALTRLAHLLEQQHRSREAYATYQTAEKIDAASPVGGGPWAQKQIEEGLIRLAPKR
jgi:hypothetical protein